VAYTGEALLDGRASLVFASWSWLNGGYIGRARALLALPDGKLDLLALIKSGVTLGLDLRVVDEQVLTPTVRSDETESL